MIAILVIILMSSPIECKPSCDAIKRNGVFTGLQIYRRYTDKRDDSPLVMNNKNGTEWLFNITSNGNFSITMNDTTATTDVIADYRFGKGKRILSTVREEYRNCLAFSRNTSLEVKCVNESDNTSYFNIPHSTPFTEYVIMTSFISSGEEDWVPIFIFEKKSKSFNSLYYPFTNERKSCKDYVDLCKRKVPLVISEMNESLFSKIEGVVHYEYKDRDFVYLFVFRIDGRPKYCFSLFVQHISDECKSSENMRTLFEECFVEKNKVPKEEEKKRSVNPLVYVVIALVVVALINTVGILLAIRRRQKLAGASDRSSIFTILSFDRLKTTNT